MNLRYAASAVATTVGVLAGTALLTATTAQAVARPQVNSGYTCDGFYIAGVGQVYGSDCGGWGQGAGFFYLDNPGGINIQEYLCFIEPVTNGPFPGENEEGTNCYYESGPNTGKTVVPPDYGVRR
jgi:hypothetical protein